MIFRILLGEVLHQYSVRLPNNPIEHKRYQHTTPIYLWCGHHRAPREQSHGVLAKILIVKTAGSPRGAISETHLCMGKTREISTQLLNRELSPCEGILDRGSNEDQGGSEELLDILVKIPESPTRVCNLYLSLTFVFILCTLVMCLLSQLS